MHEEKEDDGERWGGDRVLKVAQLEGASDVLVVVSRWYGGELLGPVRFEHIENAARASLQEHMKREEVDEFRQRIQYLDRKISQAKTRLQVEGVVGGAEEVNEYADLTVEKAQRLCLARQKALEVLQKRVANVSAQASQPEAVEAAEAAEAEPDATPAEDTITDAGLTEEHDSGPAAASIADEEARPDANGDGDGEELKAEPVPIPHTEDAATSTAVKAEPAEIPFSSLDAPIRVKDEDEDLTLLPPPPISQPGTTADELQEEEKDDKSKIKLEPGTEIDEEANDDLTGWDDLS